MPKQLDKKLVTGIAVGVVAVLAVIIAVATYKPTIKLNEYVKVTFSGYDSVGEAEVTFDMESFCKVYEGKIKNLEGAESSGAELLAKRAIKESKLNKTRNLSNGDEVIYQWDFAVSTLENVYDCKIDCSDIKFVVKGLEKTETCDVFKDLEVTYEGIAPYGKATITNKATENYAKSLNFMLKNSFNLSNGDTVTVSLDFTEDFNNVNGYIETFGKVPEALEKEFVVEGLPEYITTTSQLSGDVLTSLKQQAEKAHAKHVEEEWCDGEFGNIAGVTGFEYVGSYVLSAIDNSWLNTSSSRVLMVYKVSAHAESKFETLSLSGDTTYYTAIIFDGAYIENDGNLVISKVGVPIFSNHKLVLNHATNTWYSRTFFFYGYSTLEALYKNEVESKLNAYSYETNIKGE